MRSKNDRIYIKKKKKCVPPIFIRTTRNKLSQTTLKDAYRLEKRWTGYHYNDAGTRWRGDIFFFFHGFLVTIFFLVVVSNVAQPPRSRRSNTCNLHSRRNRLGPLASISRFITCIVYHFRGPHASPKFFETLIQLIRSYPNKIIRTPVPRN